MRGHPPNSTAVPTFSAPSVRVAPIPQVTHITGPGDKTHGSPGRENPIVDTYNEPNSARAGEDNSNEPKQWRYPSGGHQTIHAAPGFLGSYQGLQPEVHPLPRYRDRVDVACRPADRQSARSEERRVGQE